MAKQLNVNLAFKADTSQAKSAIMDLQSSLSKIATMNTSAPGIDSSKLKAASSAAKELSIHLNNAFNAQTGNFDLSKLDRSLKTSQTNVTQLASKLLNAGAAGEQAFVKLAQTISMADRPVVTLNSKLSGILTTLKNTARWQLSSSILHGFMGAVQQAYGYAQDLNKSLNDIRIVSGQSTEQMAQFADEANKAAKNLSTTTTAYTKAALIFYQQGDKGSTITEKSDVVTKMSNVTGQSTSVVSDQLTAIWNNFNKSGDEAYEHYADVLTALGAATASSTDEIAGGLEKFAGIAETVGLSYEYAAAALATITATSRESEDVVGTALKTIFSRIQGLSLGETLDDGTDLNKYSAALEKVGISIKDQTGEIREMDDILDDMGAKWKTLSNDQQMALAQTVAGVRQYNQLMTLMNNWDFMQENVNTATNSDGALQKQQEIYEESWEAANKRVRASMEAIYTDLIDDEFFIDITNGFSGLIDSVDAFIDGIGGVKTILIGIGSIFLSSVANKIQPALENLKHSFSVVFQTAEQQAKGLATEMNESITKTLSSDTGKMFSFSSKVALENARDLNIAKAQLQAIEPKLNDLEKQRYAQELAMIEAQQKETQTVADRITVLQREKEAILDKIETESLTKSGQVAYSEGSREMQGYVSRAKADFDAADESQLASTTRAYYEARQAADQYRMVQKDIIETTSQIDGAFRQMGDGLDLSKPGQNLDLLNSKIKELYSSNFSTIRQNFEELKESANGINPAGMESIHQQIQLTIASMPEVIRESQQMRDALDLISTASPEDMVAAFEILDEVLKDLKIDTKDFGKILKEVNSERYRALEENARAATRANKELVEIQEKVNKSITNFKPTHNASTIEQFSQMAASLGKVAMAASSVRSIFQAWSNDDLSFGEKLTTSFMSFSMLVPSIIGAFNGFKNVLLSTAAGQQFLVSAQAMGIKMMVAETAAITAKETGYKASSLAVIAHKMATEGLTGAELLEYIQTKLNCDAKTAQTIAEKLNKNAKDQNTASIIIQTIATKLSDYAHQKHTKTLWTEIAAWIAAKLAAGEFIVVALALTAVIAGLALIGWGIVSAFQAIQASTPEAKLEAAKQRAEELNTAFDEAKQAAEDLKSSFDSYDSAVEALENCTEGTQEWRDALREVNTEVLNLLSKYPELATMTNEAGESAITRGKNGEMVVADWARDKIMNEANQTVINTQTAATLANQDIRKAQIVVDKKNLRSEVFDKIGFISATGTNTYAASGQGQGQTYDASAIMKGYISDHAEELAVMTPKEQKEFLSAYTEKNNISTDLDAWVTAIAELGPQFGELAGAIEANTAATQIENETIAANVLADKEEVQDSKYVDEITKIAAKDLDKAVDVEIKKLKDEGWGTDNIAKIDGANAEAKKIFEEYAKAAGITNYDLTDTTGTDKNRNFVYTNSSGQEVTVSLEAMRSVVAASKANEQLAENATQLVQTLSNKTDEQVAAITAAVTKDESNLTVAQAKGDYDITTFANELSETDLKAMGYEGDLETMRANYIKAYNEIASNAQKALTDIINDYSRSVEDSMMNLKNSDALNNLTLGQVDALGDALSQAFAIGGKNGLNAMTEIFNQANAEGFGDELINSLSEINWDEITPSGLADYFNKAGIAIQFTEEQLQDLINNMSNSVPTLEQASEKYLSLTGILKNLQDGKTIDAEQYAALGPGMEEYFMMMADGTYKLVEDASIFYETLKAQSLKGFEDIITSKESENSTINNVLNQGLSDLGGPTAHVSSQVDFLESVGYDPEKISQWRTDIQEGKLDTQALTEAINNKITSLGGAAAAEEFLTNKVNENNIAIQQSKEAMASSATSVGELNQMLDQGLINAEAYNKALETVMNAEFESEGIDPEMGQDLVEAFNEENSQINKVRFKDDQGAEHLEDITLSTEDLNEANKDAAVRYANLNKAIKDINNNYKDYEDVLKDVQKASTKQEKALIANSENGKKLQKSLADLLGTSEDLIDADLLEAIDPKDFKKAAEGDVDAIDRIRDAFIKLQTESIEGINFDQLKSELDSLSEGTIVRIDADTMPMLSKLIQAKVNAGADAAEIEALLSGFNIDADVTDFNGAMEEMIDSASSAADDVIAQTTFTQDVDTTTVSTPVQKDDVTFTETYTPTPVEATSEIVKNGKEEAEPVKEIYHEWKKTINSDIDSETGTNQETGTSVRTSNAAGKSGPKKGVTIKNAHKSVGGGGGNITAPTTNNGGGGGGSKTTRTSGSRQKKSDTVERYKEINDQLEITNHLMEKNSTLAEGMYGANRIKQMEKNIELQKKEIKLLEEKNQMAKNYMNEDKKAMEDTISAFGKTTFINDEGTSINFQDKNKKNISLTDEAGNPITLDFDEETGALLNIEEVQEAIWRAREALLDSFGNEIDEQEQVILDEFDKRSEKIQGAYDLYESSRSTKMETEAELVAQNLELQEMYYDKLNQKFEEQIELIESELKMVDYYLGKIEDDIYNAAEAMAYMTSQAGYYRQNLDLGEQMYEEAKALYEAGDINEAQYQEKIREAQDFIIENLQAIQELDKATKEYYGETLNMAQDELSQYTDLMENAIDVLDHYSSLMSLFGRSKDFAGMKNILDAQSKVLQNSYETSKSIYNMYATEASDRKKAYDEAMEKGITGYELDVLKQQWLDAENLAAEAQDQMLADAEAYAENMQAILENSLAWYADNLENALTGEFGSFDELITRLKRASSLQEEFLTDTNKIYETNKLIRNAQREIDKTTNSTAKRELKNFINKTNELQQQGKLSQYELEIQQAKYDLLLAEIALKEAQNAKSTVRLQRDSEGNFGYIYTADQTAIDDAQQKFDDAQNTLYNKGLEGANNYAQKYIETMSEMNDTMAEIQEKHNNKEYASEEEYNAAMLNARNYYYDQLKNYSHLYQVSLATDSRVAADAWSSDFGYMTTQTETWMTSVDGYVGQVQQAFKDWKDQMTGLEEDTIGKSLDDLAAKTGNITKESDALKTVIIDNLIPAFKEEFDQVKKNIGQYVEWRKSIESIIDSKEKLLETIQAEKMIGSTVYSALSGQTLRFDNYNAETGEVLVSDPETGNSMWVDKRLITRSSAVAKSDAEGWSKRDNLYNYNYTDIFGGNQNFNARRYSAGWDINHLAGSLKRNNYGFGDLDFFDYYNKGYLTDDEAIKHKDYLTDDEAKKLKDSGWSKFDTGGYTGEWGPYGKMAMLHEKELVLNQHDTENLLASMEFLTRVLEIIDLQSLNNQLGGSLLLPSTLNTESNTLEQNVHIEASFPNVVDHSEIELAFNDLINISSQYANRK